MSQLARFDGAAVRGLRACGHGAGWEEFDLGIPAGARGSDVEHVRTSVRQGQGPRRARMEDSADHERLCETTNVKRVAGDLAQRCATGAFDRLIIAAPPRGLGACREACPPGFAKAVRADIVGDYVKTPLEKLAAIIASKT